MPNPSATGILDAFIIVGCGKCYNCLSNRRRNWLFRLKQEQMSSYKSYFVTLTYDDNNSDGKLHKEHFQKFIKRVRASLGCLSYYAIGEYGTSTFRPHYHTVIFFKSNLDTNFIDVLKEKWNFGFTSVSKCTYRRLNYILHYHTRPKKVNGNPTFQLFSKGLGLDFLDDSMIDFLVNTKTSVIKSHDGGTFVIPRYYRKKILAAGYSIDPVEKNFDSDYSRERIEKVFNKPIYEVSEFEIVNYIHSLCTKSSNKINKYNHQDKFI